MVFGGPGLSYCEVRDQNQAFIYTLPPGPTTMSTGCTWSGKSMHASVCGYELGSPGGQTSRCKPW